MSFKNIKDVLSREEMKGIMAGSGWCYAYDCTCGSTQYNGWGNLSQYREDAQVCASGVSVNCTFGSQLDVC